MKKIDLHIHTIATESDSFFEFSLDKLSTYVTQLEIGCIAITNHNIFNLEQYNEIRGSLSIPVFPGIEIDLEGGHLLLISDITEAHAFAEKCQSFDILYNSRNGPITVEQLRDTFGDFSTYLLIPHYDKKPIISESTLAKLKPYVHAGEVASVKKFKSCIKEPDKLVPVLFSDLRFSEGMKGFSARQTWISLEEISLRGIKSCLSDKSKVFLSREDGNEMFQATDDGLMLSTGLNILLGERSSGKTYTLERILESIENIKYIKQFSLLQNDNAKFEEILSTRQSTVTDLFLNELKQVVDDICYVDLKQNEIELDLYLTSLLKHSSEYDKMDSFSKAKLFTETLFTETNIIGLKNVIAAASSIVDNIEWRPVIEKHLAIDKLKEFIIELIAKLQSIQVLNAKMKWLNSIIAEVQDMLRLKSTSTFPEDIDFYQLVLDQKKVEKFIKIANLTKIERLVDSKDVKGFKIIASTKSFKNATHLKEKLKSKGALVSAFLKYQAPYDFLLALKDIETIPQTDYYKFFVDVEYKTLNKHGYQVSGGERSEFNLLHEISDALQHEALLIDEPESSFDNIFLKNEVNELLKDIAKIIPVIVVTHNSTVGASIQPDWLIYTQKEATPDEVKYKVFFGHPSDQQLKSTCGSLINNYQVLMNCLEAGDNAYHERRTKSYEIFKN